MPRGQLDRTRRLDEFMSAGDAGISMTVGSVVSCVDMHELSIALSLVDVACEEKERRQLPAVRALHLRVGSLSGVVTDALVFSFDVAAAGTCIDGARLEVEQTPGRELELVAMEVAA